MVKIYKLTFKGEIVYVGKTKLSLERKKILDMAKTFHFIKNVKLN